MITIFLRRINGKGEKISIDGGASVCALMREIKMAVSDGQSSAGEKKWQMFFKGEELRDGTGQTLQQVGIENCAIVHIVEQHAPTTDPLRIKLILQHKLLTFEISQSQSIQSLKRLICSDLEINNEEDLTLSFLGVELDNNRTVGSYNFVQDILISAAVVGLINVSNYRKA
jgi:hypothetical protein